jgi:hypothetical protein
MKNLFLIGLLLIISLGCDKEEVDTSSIQGTWIETIHKVDTLVFNNQTNIFTLHRDSEIQRRLLIYNYELEKDGIFLHWMPSSYSGYMDYYFQMDSKNISIGNFYVDSLGKNEILNFSRIN